MTTLKTGLVIVAAGRGQRAATPGPKQYETLAGSPVIIHTLRAFADHVEAAATVIVHHADDEPRLKTILGQFGNAGYHLAPGGQTRQASVCHGLRALRHARPDITHVMIHDAARPFVASALLDALIDHLQTMPDTPVLPVLPIAETVKSVDGTRITGTVARETLARAQTPQAFHLDTILSLHERAADTANTAVTDDISLTEQAGLAIASIPGDPDNIKITWPGDIAAAERSLHMQTGSLLPDIRTGNGYDVHRFGPGDTVWLCGVGIPHDRALSGHSDADVGLHALTDALLATCGAGDIGDHFPPSDPQWKGAPSSIFLKHAAQIVRDHGGVIMNADVSIIAEAPKIAPFREQMCATLAELLGIARQRCSVKATTNERMGFVGRNEGIAAIATASVGFPGATP